MELAKRDKQLKHLHSIIQEKEQFLYDIHKELLKSKKDNPFLNDVVDQYTVYISELTQQNQAQYNALKRLADYISDLIVDPNSDTDMVRQCKQDMKIVQEELGTFGNSTAK